MADPPSMRYVASVQRTIGNRQVAPAVAERARSGPRYICCFCNRSTDDNDASAYVLLVALGGDGLSDVDLGAHFDCLVRSLHEDVSAAYLRRVNEARESGDA